jgi:hypothetical protein
MYDPLAGGGSIADVDWNNIESDNVNFGAMDFTDTSAIDTMMSKKLLEFRSHGFLRRYECY